jgi:hypothetical protein
VNTEGGLLLEEAASDESKTLKLPKGAALAT